MKIFLFSLVLLVWFQEGKFRFSWILHWKLISEYSILLTVFCDDELQIGCRNLPNSALYKTRFSNHFLCTGTKINRCLDELYKIQKNYFRIRYGCLSNTIDNCECIVNVHYMLDKSYKETFLEAFTELEVATNGFRSVKAERYEGKFYLAFECYP